MQIHAPNTTNHMRILNNSFLSELDLDAVSEQIDLEMAVNLGSVENTSAPSPHFLNLNCQYNFRPTNFNFLMLSRLAFASKKKRIHKLIRKKITEKRNQLKIKSESLLELEISGELKDARTSQKHLAEIEVAYPKLFKDKIAPHLKRQQNLESEGLNLSRSGPHTASQVFTPTHLYPTPLKITSPGFGALNADIPDDIIRAKASKTTIPQPFVNIYTNQPSIISISPRFKLIADPLAYEMEYKKRNVWSLRDIKTFVVSILKYTKNMEKIGEALPHKSSKEIVFFFHTFKKLINLKSEIKASREL